MRAPGDWFHGEGGAWIALIAAATVIGCSAVLWQMIN